MTWLAVFLGGGLGSLARYGTSQIMKHFYQGSFPLGTFFSNLLASIILIGALYFFRNKINDQPFLLSFVVIGFCGGFSTFSTFSYETVNLWQQGQYWVAVLNILISITACMFAIALVARKI